LGTDVVQAINQDRGSRRLQRYTHTSARMKIVNPGVAPSGDVGSRRHLDEIRGGAFDVQLGKTAPDTTWGRAQNPKLVKWIRADGGKHGGLQSGSIRRFEGRWLLDAGGEGVSLEPYRLN